MQIAVCMQARQWMSMFTEILYRVLGTQSCEAPRAGVGTYLQLSTRPIVSWYHRIVLDKELCLCRLAHGSSLSRRAVYVSTGLFGTCFDRK